jgi:hypothetical protein
MTTGELLRCLWVSEKLILGDQAYYLVAFISLTIRDTSQQSWTSMHLFGAQLNPIQMDLGDGNSTKGLVFRRFW